MFKIKIIYTGGYITIFYNLPLPESPLYAVFRQIQHLRGWIVPKNRARAWAPARASYTQRDSKIGFLLCWHLKFSTRLHRPYF